MGMCASFLFFFFCWHSIQRSFGCLLSRRTRYLLACLSYSAVWRLHVSVLRMKRDDDSFARMANPQSTTTITFYFMCPIRPVHRLYSFVRLFAAISTGHMYNPYIERGGPIHTKKKKTDRHVLHWAIPCRYGNRMGSVYLPICVLYTVLYTMYNT